MDEQQEKMNGLRKRLLSLFEAETADLTTHEKRYICATAAIRLLGYALHTMPEKDRQAYYEALTTGVVAVAGALDEGKDPER